MPVRLKRSDAVGTLSFCSSPPTGAATAAAQPMNGTCAPAPPHHHRSTHNHQLCIAGIHAVRSKRMALYSRQLQEHVGSTRGEGF